MPRRYRPRDPRTESFERASRERFERVFERGHALSGTLADALEREVECSRCGLVVGPGKDEDERCFRFLGSSPRYLGVWDYVDLGREFAPCW